MKKLFLASALLGLVACGPTAADAPAPANTSVEANALDYSPPPENPKGYEQYK